MEYQKRLLKLLDQYIIGLIDTKSFENAFYFLFWRKEDIDNNIIENAELTENEEQLYKDLASVVDYYSSYDSDFELAPGVYGTAEQVMLKAIETRGKLRALYNE